MSGMILSAQAIAATGTEYQAGTDNICYFDTATNSVICGTATTQATGQSAVSVGIGAEARNNNDIAIGNQAGLGRGDKGSDFTANTTFAAGAVYLLYNISIGLLSEGA